MISRFFIDRPIFATVLSIVITLAGGVALFLLPLSLYPPISPPNVSVDCNYPGASAQVVSESVATPIEQQVNGVEGMMYMSSQCTNDGSYNLTVTFKHGVDLNMAQVLVQNRVALALPNLPDVLKQTGVNVRKRSPDILMAIAFNSPSRFSRLGLTTEAARAVAPVILDPPLIGDAAAFLTAADFTATRYDQLYLSNYALMHIKDELARLPGVSDCHLLGQRDYSMRVWVDPEQLAYRDMIAGDVVAAIRAQNMPVASGQIGQPPAAEGQAIQVPLRVDGRLVEPAEFGEIVVKTSPDGRVARLKDVARIEMGARNEDVSGMVNGRPSVSVAVFQFPDANALDVSEVVKAKVRELSKDFPPGLQYEIRYDTTPFIRESINEVVVTLQQAVVLVAVVVLLFLQNWRSAIIPLVAVPVAIIGTFAVMAAFGFSLNNLTLFGLVLAIGIVVDDAIVVVEAVEHHIENGLPPREATIRAMEQVSGPVIAIGLVLSAVFVPCAFITGIVGQFFRQFALTIATSTIISAFNSLTLSPALAALLLRPREDIGSRNVLPWMAYALIGGWLGWDALTPWMAAHLPGAVAAWPWSADVAAGAAGALIGLAASIPVNFILWEFFRLFNATFRASTRLYGRLVGGLLRVSALVLVVYAGLVGLTYYGFVTTPTGFIPSQDMGYLLINAQLPDSTSSERSRALMSRIERMAIETPGVRHTQAVTGMSFLLSANGSNFGSMFVILDEFSQRPNPVLDRFLAWCDETVTTLDLRLEGLHQTLSKRWLVPLRPRSWAWDGWWPKVEFERVRLAPGAALARRIGPSPAMDRLRRRLYPPTTLDPRSGRPVAPPSYLEQTARRWLRQPRAAPLSGDAIANVLRGKYAAEDAIITVLGPPPVRGVGRAGGFKIMIEDRGDNGSTVLQDQTENVADRCKEQGELVGMTSVFRANVPQIYVDVDRQACMSRGVRLRDLFDTMRVYLGSIYVNDFNRFGRTWQVVVQADARFRNGVDDVARLKVRNNEGAMVPLGTLAEVREVNGPLILTRYNMYPAAPINGAAAPGVSSGDAIKLVEGIANDPGYGLPKSMAFEWTELAYLELQAGNTAMVVFGLAVVMVFLVLAAQYESWSLPLAVILVVPMCLMSAIIGVNLAYQDINIFTQIGFVVLVGLASKNAILIVEFAKHRREEGETRAQAALDACGLRLRPIIMTSFAFILGVLPLILSQGAGAEMRRTLGTTVFSGMLGVTLFGIFLTPVFFVAIDWLGDRPAFSAGPLRRASDAVLGVLSFGWVAPLARVATGRAHGARATTDGQEGTAPAGHHGVTANGHDGGRDDPAAEPLGAERQ